LISDLVKGKNAILGSRRFCVDKVYCFVLALRTRIADDTGMGSHQQGIQIFTVMNRAADRVWRKRRLIGKKNRAPCTATPATLLVLLPR
jgi:hypothetical protein